ncbi:paxillin isoform X2 [Osmerus mordax]
MNSALGSNLSELDRLLLELNAVQQNSPSFPTTEEAAPPLPSCSITHYENGVGPSSQDKPKRNGTRGGEEGRPTVESLLDELEGSVPTTSPSPSVLHSELDTPSQQQARISASCATRELDELMASLSDFKIMAQGKGGAPGGPPTQVNKLDNMLGSLQSDLHKLGVQTVAKGVCGACCKPIVGQVVTAMGRTWHPEHFVCTHCQEEIGSRNFFERDGQPYCEKDYHNLFSPRCYYCNGPILDKVVTALDRTWHPEHFFCAQCGSFFGPEGFHEKDGKAYCRKDYFDMFAPKCGGCARAILENYISALNSLWHPECFVCRECFTPFVNGSFFEHDGQPYCEVHYHERRGSLCSGCQKPITGRCITAMAKKFHPEHFVCAFCLKQLNKGTFKEQNDKPYCQGCFVKLFS